MLGKMLGRWRRDQSEPSVVDPGVDGDRAEEARPQAAAAPVAPVPSRRAQPRSAAPQATLSPAEIVGMPASDPFADAPPPAAVSPSDRISAGGAVNAPAHSAPSDRVATPAPPAALEPAPTTPVYAPAVYSDAAQDYAAQDYAAQDYAAQDYEEEAVEAAAPSSDESVPLCWPDPETVKTGARAVVRFDDVVRSLIISALSGRPIRRVEAKTDEERLAASITIGPDYVGGVVHLWGAGVAGDRASRDRRPSGFKRPGAADWRVYASRGPFSAHLLRNAGVETPSIYGDPLWFAPRILPVERENRPVEIGVVPPIGWRDMSAMQRATARRYEIPEALEGVVDLIEVDCLPTADAIAEIARRFARCRRVIVTDPCLMTLGEALGVPTALFVNGGGGVMRPRVDDDLVAIPAPARDIYAGLGADRLLVCRQPSGSPTPWEAVAEAMDLQWDPAPFDPAPLYHAFPMDPAASLHASRWALPDGVASTGERLRPKLPSPLTLAARIATSIGRPNGGGAEVSEPLLRRRRPRRGIEPGQAPDDGASTPAE